MQQAIDNLRALWRMIMLAVLVFLVCCGTTNEALYAECESRVEAPEREDECTTNDDCMTGGCSSEVCTTADDAAQLMSACEELECFAVLDACGCQQGLCKWSIDP